jgi:lipid A 3-O-deacylase
LQDGVAQFEIKEEASQTRDLLRREKPGASRGSLRSFAAQKRFAQDDKFDLSHLLALQNRVPSCNLNGMARERKLILTIFFSAMFVAGNAASVRAQNGPEQGNNEVQVWVAGGHSVPGGTSNTEVFDLGLRYGRVISGVHLPSFLRGRFEYTVDLVPVYVIVQPANTAYGWGFTPLGLKWDFVRRGRFSPYLELGGGTLFSNHDVPTYTNDVNFTPSAALGTHILGEKYNWSVELRYLHVSNAGLASFNPGLNTVEVRLGVGRFWKRR